MSVDDKNRRREFFNDLRGISRHDISDLAFRRKFQLALKLGWPSNPDEFDWIPSTLYHYTSLKSAVGILEPIKDNAPILRVSNVTSLNDRGELIYGLNLLREFFLGSEHWKIFESVIDEIESVQDSIGCFSFSGSYDSIPLWQAYGEFGNGVSIGFASEKLIAAKDHMLGKVLYNSDAINHYLTSRFEPSLGTLLFLSQFDSLNIRNLLFFAFATVSLLIKKQEWEHECEWRLIPWKKLESVYFSNNEFRTILNDSLDFYASKDFQLDGEFDSMFRRNLNENAVLIPEIVLGSKQSEDQLRQFEKWLTIHGYQETNLIKSETSLC